MALDPNVELAFRGIELPNPLAQYGQLAQIQGIQQANALRGMQMRELEEGIARRNRLAAQLGAPEFAALKPEEQIGALTRGGFLTEARSLAESQSKVGKEQREAEKSLVDIAAANMKSARDLLPAVKANPAAWDAWRADTIQKLPGLASIIPQQYSPQAADALMLQADKALEQHFVSQNLGGTERVVAMPKYGAGAAAVVPGSEAQRTMAPGEAQRIDLERQRVGLEGQRVALAQEEARLKREGIEGIAPKELQKRNAALPQAKASVESFESKTDQFIKELENLRDDPGLDQITGSIYGRTPSVSREGSRAQALYNKIFAKGGFQALQDLREASKTGGALGNVSNQEGERLERSIVGGLDRTQNIADVKQGINDLIENLKVSKARVRNTFDETYSYRNPQQTKALTPADQQALDWANANPKDPRAAQIKQRLGL